MTTIAAIRTHRWGEDEERLAAQLAPAFGDRLCVVFHNRPAGLTAPLPVVDLTDAWVTANRLRATPDYGWRCGDYAYYALREAHPRADRYWLIEPDVLFRGDAAGFFTVCDADSSDALGAWFGPPRVQHMFLAGVADRPHFQAIFPVTRLSGRAIDWLVEERRQYSTSPVRNRFFTNDEMFVFSWLASDPRFTVRALEEVAPGWLQGTHFAPNPDIVMEAALDPARPDGLYHPVRTRESYGREIGRRIVATQRFRKILEPSLGHLDDRDATLIAASIERELQDLFRQTRQGALQEAAT